MKMAIDPICGMTVDPAKAAGQYDHKGTTYYFCGTSCLERFRTDPDRALSKKPLNLITMPTPRKPLPMMAQPAIGEERLGESRRVGRGQDRQHAAR